MATKDPLKGVAKTIQKIASGKTGIKTVDKQKKKDAAITKNLKRMAKTSKVRAKPVTLDITPKAGSALSIQKETITMAKDGGLMEAIEKVKKEDAAKMAEGGVPPRRTRPARGPRRMGFLGQAVDEFIETMEPFQGTVRKGETLRNVDGKTMVVRRVPNPNFRANTISDADRSLMRNIMGEQGRTISDADRQMMIQMMGARRMADGGKVPAKFKGFSKLPEDVQEQMNPTLAKKFKKGGVVKMGKGGGVCKGMGIARAGGKFKLR